MTHAAPSQTDQLRSENSGPIPPVTLVETRIDATAQQEVMSLAALIAMIQVATHLAIAPRSEAEVERDRDNMPV